MKRYVYSNKLTNADRVKLIEKNNPVHDDYHTWIRNESDILTFEEAWSISPNQDEDFTEDMAQEAMRTGHITVYSSYPIRPGVFVSPSKMEARAYSSGKIYSKEVELDDVSWIDSTQGQYTPEAQSADDLPSDVRSQLADVMDFIISEYADEYSEDEIVNMWKDQILDSSMYDDISVISDAALTEFGQELYEDYL